MTKYEVMSEIRSMDKENVEAALFDALAVIANFIRDEGYIPSEATLEYGNITSLVIKVKELI